MAVAPTRQVAPGDTSVATAANRVGTGTRAPSTQRVEGLGSGGAVSPRHEWRPAEDHGYGEPGFDQQHRRGRPPADFSPLVLRFAAAYVANQQALEEQGQVLHVLFADTLRGVGVYEANLRLFAANDAVTASRRGSQINRFS